MTDDLAIEATGLTKSFNSGTVVRGIDLEVAAGTVFGLLGPNGAGKTTTVRILATLTPPDRGRASVAGADVVAQRADVRRRISLTGQYAAVDGLQTGRENLTMVGRLQGLAARAARDRAAELLTAFDLVEAGDRRVATYSGGMRRRLDLAASLVGRPQVVFLDEPTAGLDPRSRQRMWSLVGDLTAAGVTVFLTTQYLEEADRLADRIAVLDRGAIVAQGTAAELKARVGERRVALRCADRAAYETVAVRAGGRALARDPASLTLEVAHIGGAAGIRGLLDELDPGRREIADLSTRSASLDDAFLTLTGHAASSPSESEPTHE
jgi:ABC-2 type transport system ATP-binding protein